MEIEKAFLIKLFEKTFLWLKKIKKIFKSQQGKFPTNCGLNIFLHHQNLKKVYKVVKNFLNILGNTLRKKLPRQKRKSEKFCYFLHSRKLYFPLHAKKALKNYKKKRKSRSHAEWNLKNRKKVNEILMKSPPHKKVNQICKMRKLRENMFSLINAKCHSLKIAYKLR
jgi:hypothetical protein